METQPLKEADFGNTEHEVNIKVVEDWMQELELDCHRLTPYLCPSRIKVLIGRLSCKVQHKGNSNTSTGKKVRADHERQKNNLVTRAVLPTFFSTSEERAFILTYFANSPQLLAGLVQLCNVSHH